MNLITKKEHNELLFSFAEAARETKHAASLLEPYALGALISARDSGYKDLYYKYMCSFIELGILKSELI